MIAESTPAESFERLQDYRGFKDYLSSTKMASDHKEYLLKLKRVHPNSVVWTKERLLVSFKASLFCNYTSKIQKSPQNAHWKDSNFILCIFMISV